MRYFFDISYHGKQYHGWQKQKNALSVEYVVTEAISKILSKDLSDVKCVASGRTDRGVHAEQQIFHTDFKNKIDIETLKYRLNRYLPSDISINSIRRVKDNIHARFDAIERSYEYRIRRIKNPFDYDLFHHYYLPLDIKAMNKASKLLLGTHDFQCFSRTRTDVNHFVCDIKMAEWMDEDDQLIFRIKADRFLRGMVRAIVGTLLKIGKGKLTIKEFKEIIKSKDRRKAGEAVPAKGLFLISVSYPEQIYLD